MTRNLLTPFLKNVSRQPDRAAIIDQNGTMTYAQLADRSAALATYLRSKGVRANDRVLLARALDADLFVTLAALWRLGAVIVFPEPALGLKGLTHAVEIAKPDVLLTDGKYRFLPLVSKALRRIPKRLSSRKKLAVDPSWIDAAVTEDDTALISFTSGSTGIPKAIARTHGFLLAQSDCLTPLLGQGAADDIDLVAFPMFVVANLAMGLTSVLPDWKTRDVEDVSPEHLAHFIHQHKITRMLIPPVLCEALVRVENPSALRAVFTGGGPVFPDLLRGLAEQYPQADLVCVYGSTEAEPIAHYHYSSGSEALEARMASGAGLFAGLPVPGISIRIEADEILVTGDHVNQTYMNGVGDAENKCLRDGQIWHRTGDAGALDTDGLWLLGRHSAKTAGLYPFQVEVAARSWPGVKQAALAEYNGAVLVLSGEESQTTDWQTRASKLGPIRVERWNSIPMDKRHSSKVDYVALEQRLKESST